MSIDINAINDQYLIYICLHDKYRAILKKHLKVLNKLYHDRSDWSDIVSMVNCDNLTQTDFEMYLTRSEIYGPAKEQALSYFKYADNVSESGDKMIKDSLKKLVASQLLLQVSGEPNPLKVFDNLLSYDFDFNGSDIESLIKEDYNFADVDISKARESLGDPIISSQSKINEAFIIGGYIKHQLIGVVAAPGNGKSLFCMNETAQFIMDGRKVLYIALGDLMQIDFITRLSAIVLNITIDDATNNVESAWRRLKNKLGDKLNNLKILYMDPGTVTIDMLEKYLSGENKDKKNYFEEYSICFIDYDTNFLSENAMYEKGEETYNRAAAWSKVFDLVFLVSQPKAGYSDAEIIPQEGLAESWRKAQILDCIIAIGRCPDCVNPVGSIHIAKVRRGGVRNIYKYYLGLNGRFSDIGLAQYHMLASSKDRVLVGTVESLSNDSVATIDSLIVGEMKVNEVKDKQLNVLSQLNNVDDNLVVDEKSKLERISAENTIAEADKNNK